MILANCKIYHFLIILLLFPIVSEAGEINEILFDDSGITINHHNCKLKPIMKWGKKLILPMSNCVTNNGIINVSHPALKRIHWGQHNPNTVWIVVTFSTKEYQFHISSFPNRYFLCFSKCEQSNSKKTNQLGKIRTSKHKMFLLRGILFQIPLQGMKIEEFLDRSIGFVPKDVIKDGLPHFGAKRDDWKRKRRRHKGYDIYANKINVIAAADGRVIKVRRTRRAGLYVKLHHSFNVHSLYIHLTSASVKTGQKVKQGEIIGRINGTSGNAISPQLHFEIKYNNRSVDPLPLIERYYQYDKQIIAKIRRYKKLLSHSITKRNRKVKRYLKYK
jgi:hypothetical protein